MKKCLPLSYLLVAMATPIAAEETPTPPALDQGQWVSIPGADSEFKAIYTASIAPKTHGAVVLIPDHHGHPDQPTVVGPLRTGMPTHGWSTLAIPTPPTGQPGGLLDIGTRRLQAAIDYLKQHKPGRIILVGHGLGATLSAAYLASQTNTQVTGLVAISWYDPEGAQGKLTATEAIAALSVPVYDIYGSRDWHAVQQGAPHRLTAARQANRRYRQKRIEGADHDHTGLGPALTQQIRGWLHATLVKGNSTR